MQPKDLRSGRLALGWTQAELAAALGVTRDDVQAWEEGTRPIDSPWRVEQLLDGARMNTKRNGDMRAE